MATLEERIDRLETDIESVADFVANQATKQVPQSPPRRTKRARRIDPIVLVFVTLGIVMLIAVSPIAWNAAMAWRNAVVFGEPLVAEQAATSAEQQPSVAAPAPRANVVVMQRPAEQSAAPVPVATPVYDAVVPRGMAAAWSPGGAVAPDVTGRRYRVLSSDGAWLQIELDDSTALWITPAQPVAVESGPVATTKPFSMFVTPQPTTQPQPTFSMFVAPPATPYATPTNLELIPNLGAKP